MIVVSGTTTMPASDPVMSSPSAVVSQRIGRSAERSTPASTQRPSVIASAAGPSHASMTLAKKAYIALCAAGIVRSSPHASGISISLAVGASRPERTNASNTASNAAVSLAPAGISGLMSAECSPNADAAILISWDFIQFLLPRTVLISPLWARQRNGCASHHCGKVLVL